MNNTRSPVQIGTFTHYSLTKILTIYFLKNINVWRLYLKFSLYDVLKYFFDIPLLLNRGCTRHGPDQHLTLSLFSTKN